MALKSSTGLRTQLLDTAPLRTVLALGFIKVYSGSVPATADAALTGDAVLLRTISVNGAGTGLSFEAAAVDGVIYKRSDQVWTGVNTASGLASFYRHVTASDSGGASTTEARLQGLVGTIGTEMVLADPNLVAGPGIPLELYAVAIPSL